MNSSQQLQQQLYYQQQQQHKKEEREQSALSNQALATQLKELSIDCDILYTALRSVSSGCISAWKKEKAYFLQLLHEIPTGLDLHLLSLSLSPLTISSTQGTLEPESLREFMSYNINTKLSSQEALVLIYYFNGSLHRFTNSISLSDLVKDMKLLALKMPSAILSPPTEPSSSSSPSPLSSSTSQSSAGWYDHWCHSKVREIELYFHSESQRILRINEHQNSSSGIGSHLNRLKRNNQQSHLLNRLKIPTQDSIKSEENDGGEEEDVDDDATISTLGMESVRSPLNPIKARTLKDKQNSTFNLRQLNRQSSSSSSLSSTSASSVILSPIKSFSSRPAAVPSSSSSSSSSSSLAASPLIDIHGKMQSIHYNLASPHIYSIDALKERNKLLKERDKHFQTKEPSGTSTSVSSHTSSLENESSKKKVGFSFALGAAIVARAHQVKTKLAEENEEILLEETAVKERQQKGDSRYGIQLTRHGILD
jgi:hypothetical protein